MAVTTSKTLAGKAETDEFPTPQGETDHQDEPNEKTSDKASERPQDKVVSNTVPDKEKAETKAQVDAQPKFTVFIPEEYGDSTHNGIRCRRYQINDVDFYIPVETQAEVPETIFQIWNEQRKADQMNHPLKNRKLH